MDALSEHDFWFLLAESRKILRALSGYKRPKDPALADNDEFIMIDHLRQVTNLRKD